MRKNISGFTLLEVLVAMAVAGIGLAGVIKVAGSNAYNAQYLEEKTIAQWVAMNRMAKLRMTNQFPKVGKEKGDAEMAGRKWYWQQETRAAPFPIPDIAQRLRQVEVSVYTDEAYKTAPLTSISTFIASGQ